MTPCLHGRRAVLGALLALGLVAGCAPAVSRIATLLKDPGRFDHQAVRVDGSVESALSVLDYGVYQVNDGSLTIVTKSGGAPRQGSEVRVDGEFRSAFTLGTETMAVLIESKRTTTQQAK